MIFHRFGVLTIKYALKRERERERGLVSIVGKKKKKNRRSSRWSLVEDAIDKPFADVSVTSIIDLAPNQERSNTCNCFISRKGSV